ncbi:MAG: glycosyltransferase family 4 protein, partial [Candidatus Aminicenantes bacterium]|nr:glycosyltransferase family 4 protein [Candidatus Aminicenantes bacterium]
MIKVGIVVQRYGAEVVGGAEVLARNVAERLNSNGFDVTVFTTTACDYITWSNYFHPGESILKGVIIKRYKVEKPRDIKKFNAYSEEFFASDSGDRDEQQWILKQGPVAPDLIDALRDEQKDHDVFLFFTYLYYTTVHGLKVITRPTILFPTAHDEPPIYLKLMRDVFHKPDALFFLTAAELNFVRKQFNPVNKMELVRTGIDIDYKKTVAPFREIYMIYTPYILYAGRLEKGKGLELVFQAFQELKKTCLIDLILIGKQLMDIPRTEGIRYLGYISENEKMSAFENAVISVQPSSLESLSITTLESFSQKTPVLVNRQSAVLEEHVKLSGGGLSYESVEEFIEQFKKIYYHPQFREKCGQKGYEYLIKYYSWNGVMKK